MNCMEEEGVVNNKTEFCSTYCYSNFVYHTTTVRLILFNSIPFCSDWKLRFYFLFFYFLLFYHSEFHLVSFHPVLFWPLNRVRQNTMESYRTEEDEITSN